MRPCDLDKDRDIAFDALPSGQAERARLLLQGLEGLSVAPGATPTRLRVRYNICEYTLESLERALTNQGFRLDTRVATRFRRALAYFCESVQRGNVEADEPDLKSQQAFMKVYESHLHGDRDDTPEAWRDYK